MTTDIRPAITRPVMSPAQVGTDELAELRELARRRAAGEPADGRLVVVMLGTDHHRFDRLSGWVESWLESAPTDIQVIVQTGTSRRPEGAHSFDMLRRADLLRFMRGADAVVTQGGPGGILDARACGRLPIVVPRSAALHEHVDDHQQAFARHMAEQSRIALALDEQSFRAELDHAVRDPGAFVASRDVAHIATSVGRFGALIDELMQDNPPRQRRHSLTAHPA